VTLEELVRTRNRQAEGRETRPEPQANEYEENDALESEEDVGVLRLLLFEAALKERRVLESEG
jgi:hypothetical protein